MLGVRTLAVLPGPQELAEAVGDALLSRLRTLIEGTAPGRRINLAISGGAITSSLLPSLRGRVGEVDWSRVRVWFVDERYVAAGDPDRNDDQAWEGFFHAAAGVEFVRMPSRAPGCRGDDGLDAAALAFEDTLIGMGPDGHIASLFPGRIDDEARPILAVRDSPKPPPERITVSMPLMRRCAEVWLATSGAAKARAIGEAFAGASPHRVPVAGVLTSTTRVYLDAAAAADMHPR